MGCSVPTPHQQQTKMGHRRLRVNLAQKDFAMCAEMTLPEQSYVKRE